jgi:hypothetical protein
MPIRSRGMTKKRRTLPQRLRSCPSIVGRLFARRLRSYCIQTHPAVDWRLRV